MKLSARNSQASGMATAPWKQLLISALESNGHLKHSSFFQLATIGTNGRPSNRTVVFRGFQGNTDKIQINTDGRSRKIEELKHCSSGEICWYFTDSWEQFRISGQIDIIDGSNPSPLKLQDSYEYIVPQSYHITFPEFEYYENHIIPSVYQYQMQQREKSWFVSSLRSRLQYLGPNPGLPCLSEETQPEISLDPSAGPVDAFCLLILDPDQVDYLNLMSNQRLTYRSSVSATAEKSWSVERVNP